MTIGERIKAKRKELGLSVDEVAEKLGKNRATVYRYESNDIEKLPTTVLEPLAKVLGVTPAYLMGWEENKWVIDKSINNGLPIVPGSYPELKLKQMKKNEKIEALRKNTNFIPVLNINDVNRTALDPIFEREYDFAPLAFPEIKSIGQLIYVKYNSKYDIFKGRMFPLIEENDIILLDYTETVQNGEMVLIEFYPGKHFICRYSKRDDCIEFQFLNSQSVQIKSDDKDFHCYDVRGIVKRIIKNIN